MSLKILVSLLYCSIRYVLARKLSCCARGSGFLFVIVDRIY